MYEYYYTNTVKLFSYFTEAEILNLLETNRVELYRYHLRRDYFDNRTLIEILDGQELHKIFL